MEQRNSVRLASRGKAQLKFLTVCALFFSVSLYLGMQLPVNGTMLRETSFFKKSVFSREFLIGAAFPQLLATAAVTVGVKSKSYTLISACVFSIWGLCTGHGFVFSAAEPLYSAVLISFSATGLLLLIYASLLEKDREKRSFLSSLLCYLTVSGAAVLLRAAPYFFI